MAGAKTVTEYISDDGNGYRYRMDASNATAAGNAAASSTERLPGGYRPRYVLATNPTTGNQRRIVICNPESALWTGATATITIEAFNTSPSAQLAHPIYSRVGEKRYNL